MIEFLIERFSQIGQIPLCNGIAERAPHIMGYCFPLCYRCTFIVIFFIITLWFLYRKGIELPIWLLVFCLFPMIIDGGLQTFLGIMSDNLRRAMTGSLFGFGLAGLITWLYMYIDERTF